MSGIAENALFAVPDFDPLVTALRGTALDPTQPQFRQADGRSYDHLRLSPVEEPPSSCLTGPNSLTCAQ
jgi:hypothetical protein